MTLAAWVWFFIGAPLWASIGIVLFSRTLKAHDRQSLDRLERELVLLRVVDPYHDVRSEPDVIVLDDHRRGELGGRGA